MAEEKKSADEPQNVPAPEELHPQGASSTKTANSEAPSGDSGGAPSTQTAVVTRSAKRKRAAYNPGHKGTFIGLAVVSTILVINAVGLWFLFQGQQEAEMKARESVTLSAESLSGLGVSRNNVGAEGVELTVNPDAKFGGTVTIAGDTNIAGKLSLNGEFSAPEGTFTDLQGGETAVESLNVNADVTATDLNLRGDLTVLGATRLQGQVTVSQLMTVNNNLNVAGSLSVGGSLAVKNFSVGDITISGHLIVKGATPSVSAGSASGSNGTVSVSGNDTSGTVAVNIGTGAGGGTLVNLTFAKQYATTPHVVVTSVGRYVPFYINRSSTGFSIHTTSGLSVGGVAFDYVVIN
jgi:hypothetical protein